MKMRNSKRRGVALVVLLVLLVAIVSVMGTLTWNTVAQRKFHAQRLNRMQAEWLARGGIERARAQSARSEIPTKGEWRPLGERGLATIDVQTNTNGALEVKCEATYPADEPRPVTREAKAILRPNP